LDFLLPTTNQLQLVGYSLDCFTCLDLIILLMSLDFLANRMERFANIRNKIQSIKISRKVENKNTTVYYLDKYSENEKYKECDQYLTSDYCELRGQPVQLDLKIHL
jgi:hypothetical protein